MPESTHQSDKCQGLTLTLVAHWPTPGSGIFRHLRQEFEGSGGLSEDRGVMITVT